jgi:hypothetical protein
MCNIQHLLLFLRTKLLMRSNKDVVDDRRFEIDSTILRIMKNLKSLSHRELVSNLHALLGSKFKVFLGTSLSFHYMISVMFVLISFSSQLFLECEFAV